MPRLSDTTPIKNEKLDRRVKLTAEDKEVLKHCIIVLLPILSERIPEG